jgi:hypothetical protein
MEVTMSAVLVHKDQIVLVVVTVDPSQAMEVLALVDLAVWVVEVLVYKDQAVSSVETVVIKDLAVSLVETLVVKDLPV